jgi:hypothetical protein
MNHAKIVDASGGQELVVEAKSACRSGVVERQVKVHYLSDFNAKFISYQMQQYVVSLKLILDNAYDRQHVFLFRQWISLVDGAVEMDGQMRDSKQRSLYPHVDTARMENIFAAEHHSSCNR